MVAGYKNIIKRLEVVIVTPHMLSSFYEEKKIEGTKLLKIENKKRKLQLNSIFDFFFLLE
jgi:hypothetical protein